jgi:hypothetical protein
MREDREWDRHRRQQRGDPQDGLSIGTRFDTHRRIAVDDAL